MMELVGQQPSTWQLQEEGGAPGMGNLEHNLQLFELVDTGSVTTATTEEFNNQSIQSLQQHGLVVELIHLQEEGGKSWNSNCRFMFGWLFSTRYTW